MNTSVAVIALTGVLALQGGEGPTWIPSYAQAIKQSETSRKPVAVVFGSGPAGYEKLSQAGTLNAAARKLLAEQYVCCYIDVDTKAGRDLANAFAVTGNVGLVVSDRGGKLQAFHCNSALAAGDLLRCLERF